MGWWRPDGEPLGQAPIVFLGSEGKVLALAVTPADLLTQLATRRTGLEELDEAEAAEQEEYALALSRSDLNMWLRAKCALVETASHELESRMSCAR